MFLGLRSDSNPTPVLVGPDQLTAPGLVALAWAFSTVGSPSGGPRSCGAVQTPLARVRFQPLDLDPTIAVAPVPVGWARPIRLCSGSSRVVAVSLPVGPRVAVRPLPPVAPVRAPWLAQGVGDTAPGHLLGVIINGS